MNYKEPNHDHSSPAGALVVGPVILEACYYRRLHTVSFGISKVVEFTYNNEMTEGHPDGSNYEHWLSAPSIDVHDCGD